MIKIYHIKIMAICACILLSVVSCASANGNQPPQIPAVPSGREWGRTNRSYMYSTNSSDPDGDKIWYNFSWGDGTSSDWIGPYDSGDLASARHIWYAPGRYEVKVKAKDKYGAESDWSEVLTVNILGIAMKGPFRMFPL